MLKLLRRGNDRCAAPSSGAQRCRRSRLDQAARALPCIATTTDHVPVYAPLLQVAAVVLDVFEAQVARPEKGHARPAACARQHRPPWHARRPAVTQKATVWTVCLYQCCRQAVARQLPGKRTRSPCRQACPRPLLRCLRAYTSYHARLGAARVRRAAQRSRRSSANKRKARELKTRTPDGRQRKRAHAAQSQSKLSLCARKGHARAAWGRQGVRLRVAFRESPRNSAETAGARKATQRAARTAPTSPTERRDWPAKGLCVR